MLLKITRKPMLFILPLLLLFVAACAVGSTLPVTEPFPTDGGTEVGAPGSSAENRPETSLENQHSEGNGTEGSNTEGAGQQQESENTGEPQENGQPQGAESDQPPPAQPGTTGNGSAGSSDNNGVPQAPPEPPQDDGPVILTISGDGVSAETIWTLGDLLALRDGYREITYSTTNNWPSFGHMTAHGVSITYLLRQAGIQAGATSIKFTATDGYFVTLTYDQVFGRLYTYANHSASGSSGASAAEPLIAWEWGDSRVRPENIRPFFGQSGPMEVNTAAFVKDLYLIEVFTASVGVWPPPGVSIAEGEVPAGTELLMLHDNIDSIRIYYTLDGSDPDYSSAVFNRSTSYFQPHLIVPLEITEDVTIKAFAAGLGRAESQIATFTFTVQ